MKSLGGLPFIDYGSRFQGPSENPLLEGYKGGSEIRQRQEQIEEQRAVNQLNTMKYLAEQQKSAEIKGMAELVNTNPNDSNAIRRLAALDPGTAERVMAVNKVQNEQKGNILQNYQRQNIAEKPALYQQIRQSILPSIGVDTSAWPTEYGDVANGIIEQELNTNRSTKDVLDEEGSRIKNRLNEQKIITEQTQQIKNLQEKQGVAAEKSSNLRKELNQRLDYFTKARDAYDNIAVSAKNPTPAGDMSLIFAYMKLLDPPSTVREKEYAAAENARGVPEGIRNLYNKTIEGKLLTQKQREDFSGRANSLYKVAEKNADKTIKQYRGIAERAGIKPEDVIIDFTSFNANSANQPKEEEQIKEKSNQAAQEDTHIFEGQSYKIRRK